MKGQCCLCGPISPYFMPHLSDILRYYISNQPVFVYGLKGICIHSSVLNWSTYGEKELINGIPVVCFRLVVLRNKAILISCRFDTKFILRNCNMTMLVREVVKFCEAGLFFLNIRSYGINTFRSVKWFFIFFSIYFQLPKYKYRHEDSNENCIQHTRGGLSIN